MEEAGTWEGDFDPFADPEERRVLFATLDSFRQYRRASHYNATHVRRQSFYALPSSHWELLASPPFSILDHFNAVDDAIDANAEIADKILEAGLTAYGLHPAHSLIHEPNPRDDGAIQSDSSVSSTHPPWHNTTTPADLEKARSTIRQLWRDWSEEGAQERSICYLPIRSSLSQQFQNIPAAARHQIRVLVPGAGLGRLVFDLVLDGYCVEGNEISYHQLLASNFILNCATEAKQFALYPWALSFSNHVSREHQLQNVLIPDVHPATTLQEACQSHEVPASDRMSMSAADFCVHYRDENQKDAFDAVASVFFIDTAPNLLAYIETVKNCLRKGGVWTNVGPLLWHFEKKVPGEGEENGSERTNLGIGEAGSIELTNEEVLRLVEHYDFEIVESGSIEGTGYIQDPRSMLQNIYKPQHWTARKK
ncbi:MAG: hypothetical protein M1821_006833 [Bathelium mastoideum]|nr:MAG: hypothetical protein M1821_006833 [Bathelium mastoideum]